MKPIKLKLSGLQSFKDTQEIEFDKLDDLFIITGETGSGKSTILDAMILALYNKIPRNEEGESSSKDTLLDNLNNSCTEMFVEFTFKINNDIYQIKRSYDYKESRKNKFNSKDPILKKNDDIIASKNNEVKEVLNDIFPLSYEDFTKTVILVQNKFSDFIKLKNKDKRDMLENIFDLAKYGDPLSKKIKTELDNNSAEIEAVKKYINDAFTDELLVFLKSQIDMYNTNINSYEEYISKINSQKEIQTTLSNYKIKLEKLQKEDIEIYSNKINLHNKFKEYIPLIENKNRYIKDITKFNKELEENKTLKNQLEKSIGINESSFNTNKNKYLDLENKYKAINYSYDVTKELNDKLSLKKEQLQYNIIKDEITEINNNINTQVELVNNYKLNLEKLNKENNFDIDQLNKDLFEVNSNLKKCEDYSIKLQQVNTHNNSLEEENKNNIALRDESSSKLFEINSLINQNKAVSLALTLKDDTPCPVCGSLDHPSVATTSVEIDHGDLVDSLTYKIDNLNLKINSNTNTIYNNKEIISEINQFFKNNTKNDLIREKDNISNSISNYNNLTTEIKNIEITINKTNEYITRLREQLTNKSDSLNKLENCNQIVITESIEELNTLLKENEQKRLESEKLNKQLNVLKDEVNDIKTNQESLKIKLEHTLASISKDEDEVVNLRADLDIINAKLPDNIEEISKSILDEKTYIEYNDYINEYNTNLNFYQKNINEYIKRVDSNIDITKFEYYEALKKNTIIINLKLEGLYNEESDKTIQLTDYKTKLTNLRTKQKSYEGIYNVVRRQNFVEHLAGFKLKSILSEASKRLSKITNGRYELILVNNIEFELIDNLNGGSRRKTTTLSGGETFMVSLCLALALSNQVQVKNKTPLEFFFLDEGFGTLDETSLNKVINTLEELRSSDNLKIGLISHVDSLKEKINSKIIVTKADEISGSTLKISNY